MRLSRLVRVAVGAQAILLDLPPPLPKPKGVSISNRVSVASVSVIMTD